MLGEPLSMLVPQVVGFKLPGELPQGLDGDRSRADGDRDPAQGRCRRQVRRVLRPRRRVARARRPRDAREHEPGVRRDVRLLPGRRRDARVPAPDGPPEERVALVEAYCKENMLWHDPTSSRPTRRSSSSISPTSSPRSPARAARRTACRSRAQRSAFIEALDTFGVVYTNGSPTKPSPTPSRRAIRPPSSSPAASPSRSPTPGRARGDPDPHGGAGRGRGLLARARLGRHRGDHVVHEHLEPVGDDRRRAAREEGGRARA